VRLYLRYSLSYRDLEEMMRERSFSVDYTTIFRWVQRYSPEFEKRCRPYLLSTNDSHRVDETYVKIKGKWSYLYERAAADLPWEGIPIRLRLQVRKFFCPNSECQRRIFCERLPGVVAHYAHRTDRLNEAFSSIGFALGGRPRTKAATKLGMQTEADSILRRVRITMARPSDEMKVRAIGVDDWVLRRGRITGSMWFR
jgi:hypothetical protein